MIWLTQSTLKTGLQTAATVLHKPGIRCIKQLKGDLTGYYRYRVGDYRVVYCIDDEQKRVVVTVIAHRREVY